MNILSNFRLKDDAWFQVNQSLLLKLAATGFGRDLLGIPKDFPLILKITKEGLLGYRDGEFVSRIRCRSPYGNAIRTYWRDVRAFANYADQHEYFSPLTRQALALSCTTDNFSPDANPETTTVDGRVADYGANSSWAASWGAATGTVTVTSDSGNFITAYVQEAGGLYYNIRGMMLFNTGPTVPSGNAISSASLNITTDGKFDSLPADARSYVAVTGSANPASNTAIVAADWDQCGTTTFSNNIDIGSIAGAGSSTDWTINASGIAAIAKGSGVTKFGLKEGHDVENVDPGAGGESGANFRSAETANDPVLTVIHEVAASARSNFLLLDVG